jgi:hypothetical protein
MALNTQANGLMAKQMELVLRLCLMVRFMMGTGPMGNLITENVHIQMARFMRVNGKMVNPLAKELRHGLMVENMMAYGD